MIKRLRFWALPWAEVFLFGIGGEVLWYRGRIPGGLLSPTPFQGFHEGLEPGPGYLELPSVLLMGTWVVPTNMVLDISCQ